MHMHMCDKGRKMNMLKDDKTLRRIIQWIAENPGVNLYQTDYTNKKLRGVNRTTAMRKIKNQYRLVEKGYLRMEKGKRKAEKYWLTFKGLIYAVKMGINPNDAYDIRLKHEIELPEPVLSGVADLVMETEKNFPEFYVFLTKIDLNTCNSELLALMATAIAVFVFSFCYTANPDHVKQKVKNMKITMPDGTVTEDFGETNKLLVPMFRPIWRRMKIDKYLPKKTK